MSFPLRQLPPPGSAISVEGSVTYRAASWSLVFLFLKHICIWVGPPVSQTCSYVWSVTGQWADIGKFKIGLGEEERLFRRLLAQLISCPVYTAGWTPAYSETDPQQVRLFIASFPFALEEFPQNLSSVAGKEPQTIYDCFHLIQTQEETLQAPPEAGRLQGRDLLLEGMCFARDSTLKDSGPESGICPWE